MVLYYPKLKFFKNKKKESCVLSLTANPLENAFLISQEEETPKELKN
jgi:hypothetical protein